MDVEGVVAVEVGGAEEDFGGAVFEVELGAFEVGEFLLGAVGPVDLEGGDEGLGGELPVEAVF